MPESRNCAWRLAPRGKLHICDFRDGSKVGPYSLTEAVGSMSKITKNNYIDIYQVVAALTRDDDALIARNADNMAIIVYTADGWYITKPEDPDGYYNKYKLNWFKKPLAGLGSYEYIGYMRTQLLFENAMQYPYCILRDSNSGEVMDGFQGLEFASAELDTSMFYLMMEKGADAIYKDGLTQETVLLYGDREERIK